MVLGRGGGGGGGGQFNSAATVSQLFAPQQVGIGDGCAGSGAALNHVCQRTLPWSNPIALD